MTTTSDESFTDKVQKILDKQFDAYDKKIKAEWDDFKSDLSDQLSKQVSSLLNGSFGGSTGLALGAGTENLLSSALSGGKINARSIADSIAGSLTTQTKDLFNMSDSQKGESLSDLISDSSRNS